MQYATDVQEAMDSDAVILRVIDDCKTRFGAGDRMALFDCVVVCARSQAVIPDWATDEILRVDADLISGVSSDFNQVFGWRGPNQRNRQREARMRAATRLVIAELIDHRVKGGSLNAEEAFDPIAEKLDLSRREVEAIYKRHKSLIKNIRQGNPENRRYGIAPPLPPPPPRRRGRPIL